jgi:hypothetical protein
MCTSTFHGDIIWPGEMCNVHSLGGEAELAERAVDVFGCHIGCYGVFLHPMLHCGEVPREDLGLLKVAIILDLYGRYAFINVLARTVECHGWGM